VSHIKVKSSPCAFFNSALDGVEWSDSRPGRFTPRERVFGAHWIGGWVGLRAGLDARAKKKISQPLPGLEHQINQSVAHSYTNELPPLHGMSHASNKQLIYLTTVLNYAVYFNINALSCRHYLYAEL
jgi:hypothetical protein